MSELNSQFQLWQDGYTDLHIVEKWKKDTTQPTELINFVIQNCLVLHLWKLIRFA